MFLNIGCIIAALSLPMYAVAVATPGDDPRFIKFKREMMPKVGQKITVVGTVDKNGKEPFFLAFNNWGAYVHATSKSGIAKENEFFAQFRSGQMVKVTGTLRYFPEPAAASERNPRPVQIPPEHLYFDAAEITISRSSPPAPKHPK
jgi:hypothetical protein